MKVYIIVALSLSAFIANAQTPTLMPGAKAPDISLLNVDNKIISFANYPAAKGFIVVFTCNTCPYSKAYEQRIKGLNGKYASRGYPVIAINPNDPQSSPGDTFDKMKQHAKAAGFTFPYLFDKGHVITALYGAKSTPTVFIISKTAAGNVIEYTGAIDNDTPDTDIHKTKWAEDAVSALLNGGKPAVNVTKAIGCRVSWQKKS